MRATVISVFKSKKYTVHYWYHNTQKCKSGNEAVYHEDAIVPMMEIKLWKEKLNSIADRRIEAQGQIVFATPEVIEVYTGKDLFKSKGLWSFEGKYLDIEFEWEEKEYPYISTYHPRDYISTEVFKMPKILKIEDPKYNM